MHVAAKDIGTGKEQSIRITAPNKLSEDEVERMQKEAEEHAEDDKKRKEDVETINQADALVYSTKKLFKEFEGKVDSKELEIVKGKIMELEELLKPESKDVAKIKEKTDEVNELVQKMSTEMYQKASQEYAKKAGGKAEGQEQKEEEGEAEEEKDGKDKEDNVVDADYEVE